MQFFGRRFLLLVSGTTLSFLLAQAADTTIRHGTSVQVQVERDIPMKVGHAVRGRLVYPLFVDNQMVLPAGTEMLGRITQLEPVEKKVQRNSRLGGDFTPLHTAHVEFDQLIAPNGANIEIDSPTSGPGAEVVRFTSAGVKHESFFKRMWEGAFGRGKDTVHTFTAPGKMERARRMLYSGLPYHPELLVAGTEYSLVFAKDLTVNAVPEKTAAQTNKGIAATVTLAASLLNSISSQDAVPGTKVSAVVTEPAFDKDHNLLVPQGSTLVGEVTQAGRAGKWGHAGTLRFSFTELEFPAGFKQRVQGTPTAIDTDRSANLTINAEGGAKPQSKGFAAPLAMGLLAVSAVHEDEASVLHTAGASNGFALIGRGLALGLKSNAVGATIGFYGTARSVYGRYIAHGAEVTFPKDTRIEVVLDPERVNVLSQR